MVFIQQQMTNNTPWQKQEVQSSCLQPYQIRTTDHCFHSIIPQVPSEKHTLIVWLCIVYFVLYLMSRAH